LLLWISSLYITLAVAVFNSFLVSFYVSGFAYMPYAMNRTMLVFLDGFLYPTRKVLLIEENFETIVAQTGVFLALFTIVAVRIVSQFLVFNLIVASILVYLERSRHEGEERARIKQENDWKTIEEEYKQNEESKRLKEEEK